MNFLSEELAEPSGWDSPGCDSRHRPSGNRDTTSSDSYGFVRQRLIPTPTTRDTSGFVAVAARVGVGGVGRVECFFVGHGVIVIRPMTGTATTVGKHDVKSDMERLRSSARLSR
jgi:hypothetical protein